MQGLKALREIWDQDYADTEASHLLGRLAIMESATQWMNLQYTFEPQLRQTEALFGFARRETLAELQSRLQQLAEWQRRYEQSLCGSSNTSEPSA